MRPSDGFLSCLQHDKTLSARDEVASEKRELVATTDDLYDRRERKSRMPKAQSSFTLTLSLLVALVDLFLSKWDGASHTERTPILAFHLIHLLFVV